MKISSVLSAVVLSTGLALSFNASAEAPAPTAGAHCDATEVQQHCNEIMDSTCKAAPDTLTQQQKDECQQCMDCKKQLIKTQ